MSETQQEQRKFRLVTRSDFDGLVCAVLLKRLDLIDDILFVHPKDMQDGKVETTERDIVTNLPYVANAHLIFDHHCQKRSATKVNVLITLSTHTLLLRLMLYGNIMMVTTLFPKSGRKCSLLLIKVTQPSLAVMKY